MIKGVQRLRRGLSRMLAAVLVGGASAIVGLAAPASAAVPNSWGFGFLNNPAPVPPIRSRRRQKQAPRDWAPR